jgi:hypothetical protein
MTAVAILEHTVYEAVCQECPWVQGGFTDRSWAEHIAEQHEKEHA